MKRTMITFAAIALATGATAADILPADVMFEEGAVTASLTGVKGDAASDRKVFANRKKGNCLACHANTDLPAQLFHGEVGPTMDGVGGIYEAAQLRGLLTNSKETFEGTILPASYKADGCPRNLEKFVGKTILTAQEVEDVLAYLQTLTE